MKGNTQTTTFLERISLSFSLYINNLGQKLKEFGPEKGLVVIFDIANHLSILTLEITLILMAAGYLTTNPYFVISTSYPLVFTLALISLISDSSIKTSTHLVLETTSISIIILLSFFFPIVITGLNISIITYYIACNFILTILFNILDVEKIVNNIASKRSSKTINSKDIEYLKQNIFSLLLIMLVVEVIVPLHLINTQMLILASATLHIMSNTAASIFNKTRNPALQNVTTLENKMPHPWLITLSKNTGVIFLGALLSMSRITIYLEAPILSFLCDVNLISSSTRTLSGSAFISFGVIAVKILQETIPTLLHVTKNLVMVENIVDDNNNPKNIHMNFFYQIFSHTLLLALSILNLDLLFTEPREYFSNIWCHLRGIIFQLWHIIQRFIVCPLKSCIMKTSEVDNLYLALNKAELKVNNDNNKKSFVYELSHKAENKINDASIHKQFNTEILSQANTLVASKIYIRA